MNERQTRARDRVLRYYSDASVHSDGRDYIVKLADGTNLGSWSWDAATAWTRAADHMDANLLPRGHHAARA